MISAITSFLNFGTLQIREIIFYKVLFLSIIFFLDIKKNFIKLKDFFRNLGLFSYIVSAYLAILIFNSVLSQSRFEDIGVAIYLIASPLIGYLTAKIFDGPNNIQPRYNALSISLYIAPSIILIYLFYSLDLTRLTLGSFALGGFLPSILIITILMRFPKENVHQFLAISGLLILLLEIFIGGSRRYLLPIILIIFAAFILWSVRKKVMNLLLLSTLSVAPLLLFFAYLNNDLSLFSLGTESFDSLNIFRSLGYRSQEIIVLIEKLNTPENILFGYQFGWTIENTLHGTKGFIDLGPRLHNLYFTLAMNGGLLLLVMYIYPFISKQLFSGITSLTGSDISLTQKMLSIFLLSNFVTVAFDSHPDGYWILGWCLYYLNLEAKQS